MYVFIRKDVSKMDFPMLFILIQMCSIAEVGTMDTFLVGITLLAFTVSESYISFINFGF